jgi:major histocompatibility complex class I
MFLKNGSSTGKRGTIENKRKGFFREETGRAVVVHTINPSTWEAEAGGFLSSRTAWSAK